MFEWLLLVASWGLVSADYQCVCNYNAEKSVMTTASATSAVIGYMYEFDCKPEVGPSGTDGWLAIAFEHKKGYVEKDDQMQIQTCPGQVPDEDKLPPTTPVPTTTTAEILTTEPTTQQPTTTTQMLTTTTTTPQPVTTRVTTTPSTTEVLTTVPTTPKPTMTTQMMTTSPIPDSTTTEMMTTEKTTSRQTTTQQMTTTTRTTATTSTTTTLSSTTTSGSTTIQPTISVLQGHTELCPNSVQQHASKNGNDLTQYGDKCYEVVQHGISWSHAEANCKNLGGHLVHIANQQEQDFIYHYLVKIHSHTVWIGLHDRNHEEHFEWTSGDPVTYENWTPGRKDLFNHNSEDCVFITPHNGEWDDVECGGNNPLSELLQGIRHAYICQYATETTATVGPTPSGHVSQGPTPSGHVSQGVISLCPTHVRQQAIRDGGILGQYDHNCYELITRHYYPWSYAETTCNNRGGHLVHIQNQGEQNYLQRFLLQHLPTHAVWIGLSDLQSEGRFHWTSNDAVQYTNWVPGHESNFVDHNQEDCVAMVPYKDGTWDDIPCGQTHHSFFGGTSFSGETHPFICQYRTLTGASLVG